MAEDKKELPEEVRAFFAELGRKSGEKLKERSLRKYGDSSEYFRRIAAKRKRFGPLPKNKKLKEN
jgi:hypothetical protein